jgi:hypothetical protein
MNRVIVDMAFPRRERFSMLRYSKYRSAPDAAPAPHAAPAFNPLPKVVSSQSRIKQAAVMIPTALVLSLFKQGLGELLVLHATGSGVCLGNVVLEKGRVLLKDKGYLGGLAPAQLAPCWEGGLLGMVAESGGHEWQSLTFYGLEKCSLPVDLGKTRHGALVAAQNQYGESLIDFVGSVYRGYRLMLDHHFLPVVLLAEVHARDGARGLAVGDLRMVPMDLSVIRNLNDVVRKSVEKRLVLDVEDAELKPELFNELFGQYLKQQP